MPVEGVYSERTGGGPFHALRYKAMDMERPYTGHHPPRLPLAVALELASVYDQIADEARRMGWVNSERDYRQRATEARTYAAGEALP